MGNEKDSEKTPKYTEVTIDELVTIDYLGKQDSELYYSLKGIYFNESFRSYSFDDFINPNRFFINSKLYLDIISRDLNPVHVMNINELRKFTKINRMFKNSIHIIGKGCSGPENSETEDSEEEFEED